MFTAENVISGALDRAPEFRSGPIDVHAQARMFNETLYELVEEVVEADAERLLAAYPVPLAVVEAEDDHVDLSDDGTGPGAREWLHIDAIDYVDDSQEVVDEVTVLAVADRHRIIEYDGCVVLGMLQATAGDTGGDAMDHLRKLQGWSQVRGLEVHGVLAPREVTPNTLTLAFSYNRRIKAAAVAGLVLRFASFAGGIDPVRLRGWQADYVSAREALGISTTRPIGGRVENVYPGGQH